MTALGKYELGERIAAGGMAEVFRARHHGAEGFVREVAIKRIRERFCTDPEFVKLFVREARLASQLHHANVVQLHDFDEVEGGYYIAMELVQGRDLRKVLQAAAERGRRFPLSLGVHVVAECCKGLIAAHELCDTDGEPLGLIHRDLSPHNVLISFAGEVKLSDFGIAKATARSHDTSSEVIRGKVPYMSPEQIEGRELDRRSDLFSLGIVLFELATGRRLYGRDGEKGLMLEVARAEIPEPASLNAEISPGLNGVILELLAREPAERFGTAREALQALRDRGGAVDRSLELAAFMEDLYPEQARAARRSSAGSARGGGDARPRPVTAQTPGISASVGGRRRARLAILTLVLMSVVAGAAYLVVRLASREPARLDHHRTPGAPIDDRSAAPPRRVIGGGAGSLEVTSEPSGAEILVDGLPTRLRTPSRFGVRPGQHRVTVRWSGGSTASVQGRALAGKVVQLELRQPPGPRARRRPHSQRRDGAPARPNPPARARLSPARTAPMTRPPPRRATGRSAASRVRFTCTPWALVSLGGNPLGQTPRTRVLGPGSYTVTFRNPSLGLRQRRSFRVTGDGAALRVRCRF